MPRKKSRKRKSKKAIQHEADEEAVGGALAWALPSSGVPARDTDWDYYVSWKDSFTAWSSTASTKSSLPPAWKLNQPDLLAPSPPPFAELIFGSANLSRISGKKFQPEIQLPKSAQMQQPIDAKKAVRNENLLQRQVSQINQQVTASSTNKIPPIDRYRKNLNPAEHPAERLKRAWEPTGENHSLAKSTIINNTPQMTTPTVFRSDNVINRGQNLESSSTYTSKMIPRQEPANKRIFPHERMPEPRISSVAATGAWASPAGMQIEHSAQSIASGTKANLADIPTRKLSSQDLLGDVTEPIPTVPLTPITQADIEDWELLTQRNLPKAQDTPQLSLNPGAASFEPRSEAHTKAQNSIKDHEPSSVITESSGGVALGRSAGSVLVDLTKPDAPTTPYEDHVRELEFQFLGAGIGIDRPTSTIQVKLEDASAAGIPADPVVIGMVPQLVVALSRNGKLVLRVVCDSNYKHSDGRHGLVLLPEWDVPREEMIRKLTEKLHVKNFEVLM